GGPVPEARQSEDWPGSTAPSCSSVTIPFDAEPAMSTWAKTSIRPDAGTFTVTLGPGVLRFPGVVDIVLSCAATSAVTNAMPVAPAGPRVPVSPFRPFWLNAIANSPALHCLAELTRRNAPVFLLTQPWN